MTASKRPSVRRQLLRKRAPRPGSQEGANCRAASRTRPTERGPPSPAVSAAAAAASLPGTGGTDGGRDEFWEGKNVRRSWREKGYSGTGASQSQSEPKVGGEDREEKAASQSRYKTQITKLSMEDDFLPQNPKLCFESGFGAVPQRFEMKSADFRVHLNYSISLKVFLGRPLH